MNVRLVVIRGGTRKIVPIRQNEAILGRGQGNTVRIPSAEVSRQHCRLSQKQGLVRLRDLGSVNGTFLNGQKIRQEEIVRPGDSIDVGPVNFVVEYELTPEALSQLHSLNDDVDVLAALADGEILDVEPAEEDDFPMLEEVLELDAEPLPLAEPPKKKKKPIPLSDTPTKPAEALDAIDPGFNFDAAAWELPDDGDLRGLMDDFEEEKPAPKKPKPRK